MALTRTTNHTSSAARGTRFRHGTGLGGRLSRVVLALALGCAIAACGGGGGGGDSDGGAGDGGGSGGGGSPAPTPADLSFRVIGSARIGHGIISPYRVAADSGDPGRIFVLTGRGETYSEGFLHVVERQGYTDLAPPLEVGINGSDFVQDGDYLLVTSRGAGRVVLVDVRAWRVVQSLPLGFAPAAIAPLGGGEFVVAGVDSGGVAVVRRDGATIDVARRTSLGTFAYDVTADAAAGRIYLSQPSSGVAVLDARTLDRERTVRLTGEPSRGILLWNGYVVVSNRDGYLHFLSEPTGEVQTLDVATALGLDRATLVTRGIDCGDVLDLGDGRLVLVNSRQDSLLLAADPGGPLPVRVLARLTGGAFATHLPDEGRVHVTLPSMNTVSRVTLPQGPTVSNRLGESRLTVGAEITSVVPLRDEPTAVAAMLSDGSIHVVDGNGAVQRALRPPSGESWLPPIAATSSGLAFVSRRLSEDSLLQVDRAGAVIGRERILVQPVFSTAGSGDSLVLVSRLYGKLQFVDLASRQSQVVRLSRERPRVAVPAGGGDWVVLHDTSPDIGVTLIRASAEAGFDPFDDWFVAAVTSANHGIVSASFNGALARVGGDGRLSGVRRTKLTAVSDLREGIGDTAWATSENLGVAHRVQLGSLSVDGRYARSGVRHVGALPGGSTLYLATAREIEVLGN